MSDPAESTSKLLELLPELEKVLEPLQAKPWSETVEDLSPLEQAKMDILLSYTINDLLKGVDPAAHEVTAELERIKKYYAKVKAVEDPAQRTKTVDKEAARRFVTAAIPRDQRLAPTSAAAQAAREADEVANERFTQRFKFVASDGDTEKVAPGQSEETLETEAEALIKEVDDNVKSIDHQGPNEEAPEAKTPKKKKAPAGEPGSERRKRHRTKKH